MTRGTFDACFACLRAGADVTAAIVAIQLDDGGARDKFVEVHAAPGCNPVVGTGRRIQRIGNSDRMVTGHVPVMTDAIQPRSDPGNQGSSGVGGGDAAHRPVKHRRVANRHGAVMATEALRRRAVAGGTWQSRVTRGLSHVPPGKNRSGHFLVPQQRCRESAVWRMANRTQSDWKTANRRKESGAGEIVPCSVNPGAGRKIRIGAAGHQHKQCASDNSGWTFMTSPLLR